MILGETPREEFGAILDRLQRQQFKHGCPAVFLLTTAGVSEDGWTVYVNGVVDAGLQVNVDDLGFLHVSLEDEVSATQRRGRAGRVVDTLFCRLTEACTEQSIKQMPYPDQQQVCLASASLGVPWLPPALEDLTQPYVEEDLFRMGLLIRSSHKRESNFAQLHSKANTCGGFLNVFWFIDATPLPQNTFVSMCIHVAWAKNEDGMVSTLLTWRRFQYE